MASMTITEFILARVAEKEARVSSVPEWHCTNSARGEAWGSRGDCPLCDAYMFDGNEVVTEEAAWEHLERVHLRSRVLAECEAMRRIVAACTEPGPDDEDAGLVDWESDLGGHAELTLRILARIWSDHPDYREEWR